MWTGSLEESHLYIKLLINLFKILTGILTGILTILTGILTRIFSTHTKYWREFLEIK